MERAKKLKMNTITSFIYQIITVMSGFILPRLFLQYYGSEVNGLISSITQFLSLISLCECGVGAVVQSALYKPIAENDNEEISRIYLSAKRFFNKIAMVLLCYIIVLIIVFPLVINEDYDFFFTAGLILAIAISSFTQYYFGICYKLIINASQLVFVQMTVNILSTILNIVLSVILMVNGVSVLVVKLVSSLLFVFQPIIYYLCVCRKFLINKKIIYTEEPIKQKWNGFAQHVATVIYENTPSITLTTLTNLATVSIFSVYHMVSNGLKLALVSLTNGMKSLLGDMYAKKEKELENVFSIFEWMMHKVSVYVFTVTAILIIPFIKVYTCGIEDANYIQLFFGVLMCISSGLYIIRLPYSYLIQAAGHYKETQKSALIESGITIFFSVVLVYKFELVGIGIALVVGTLYRGLYFIRYVDKNFINRKKNVIIKLIITDLLEIGIMVLFTCWIDLKNITYFSWLIMAVEVGLICVSIAIIMNLIFYRNMINNLFHRNMKGKKYE